ncbi:unnamed protein product [Sphagnum tenellum]
MSATKKTLFESTVPNNKVAYEARFILQIEGINLGSKGHLCDSMGCIRLKQVCAFYLQVSHYVSNSSRPNPNFLESKLVKTIHVKRKTLDITPLALQAHQKPAA